MVQVTPFKGTNLTEIAINNRNFEAQQQQLGVQNAQRDRQLGQNQDRIDMAAEQLGMTRQQFAAEMLKFAMANSDGPDMAIKMLKGVVPNMDNNAIEAITNAPAQMFGTALRSNLPASTREFNAMLDAANIDPDSPDAISAARRDLGLDARAVTAAPKVVMIGDVPHIFNPTTRKMDPVEINGRQVTPEEVATNKGTVAAGAAAGADAIAAAQEARQNLKNVKSTISNINDAVQAIDDGASSGAIASRLPSVRTASIELDNARSRLGLNIIGAVTFGALSKGELDLALDTAVPSGLRPPELRAWLVRKRDAQEKLAIELENAAIFLGTPGNTVAEYMQIMQDNGGLVMDGEADAEPTLEELIAEKQRRAQTR